MDILARGGRNRRKLDGTLSFPRSRARAPRLVLRAQINLDADRDCYQTGGRVAELPYACTLWLQS